MLDSVFGFLQRRTDFFYESEPMDKMGFPPGIAESMVCKLFFYLTNNNRYIHISVNIKKSTRKDFLLKKILKRDGKNLKNNKNYWNNKSKMNKYKIKNKKVK